MHRFACLLATAAWVFLATPAWSLPFNFSTGLPDGRLGAASRPAGVGIEIEAGDDFITTSQTKITSASFWGLLTGATTVQDVDVEIYRVFPKDSVNPPDGRVPTRVNSPSDNAFATRDSGLGQLTFTTTNLGAFTVANSVLNGINPIPNQTTLGEGPVRGTEVRFDVTFASPFDLPPDHYFFVPQIGLASGDFYWLSTVAPPLFTGDLQAWIRNANLDPDWLRIGTDIIGGTTPPRFDMAFALAGTAVPEPSTLLLLSSGLAGLAGVAWRRHRRK